MKNKRPFIIAVSTAAVVFAVIASVFALNTDFAKSDTPAQGEVGTDGGDREITALANSAEIIEAAGDNKWVKCANEGAAATREYNADGETISLSYSETLGKADGSRKLLYLDGENNEYYFDADGKFIGMNMNIANYSAAMLEAREKGTVQRITEPEAIAIAEQTMKENFGSRIDGFELEETISDDSDGSYTVFLAQKLGDGKFVTGSRCYATILADGTVYSCKMREDDFEDFDENRLKGISKEEIEKDLEQKTKELYGESLESFEIDGYDLVKIDGKYYIRVCVLSELYFDGDRSSETYCDGGQMYLYEIPVA